MADNGTTHRFPYQHLAVLGVEKLKKYVPPADGDKSSPTRIENGAAKVAKK